LAVREKAFREDLFFRLNVINIHIPPLSERKEDIPALLEHFMQGFARDQKRPAPAIAPPALAVLVEYSWPGNIRELRNFVEKLFVFFSGKSISQEEMADLLFDSTLDGQRITDHIISLSEARRQSERKAILRALIANTWDYEKTAVDLSISRASLFNKIKQYRISRPV
jgi:DNA-binding NtrC family response regulator